MDGFMASRGWEATVEIFVAVFSYLAAEAGVEEHKRKRGKCLSSSLWVVWEGSRVRGGMQKKIESY